MKIEQAIKGCIKGENKAQYELYKTLYSNFMGLCLRYRKDKDKATISFNNAFVKILKNLSKLENQKAFEGWVKRILINQMLTEISLEKKHAQRTEELQEVSYYRSATVSNDGSEKLNAQYLKKLLSTLPSATQQVFNLFAIDGFSHKEIAEMLDITDGTSKWHVAEARKRLKHALTVEKDEYRKLKVVR